MKICTIYIFAWKADPKREKEKKRRVQGRKAFCSPYKLLLLKKGGKNMERVLDSGQYHHFVCNSVSS